MIRHLPQALGPILILATAFSGQAAAAQWTPLDLPGLSREVTLRRDPPPLLDGRHLLLDGEELRFDVPRAGHLAAPTLRRMLEDEIRRRDLDVELHPSTAFLAARGGAEGLDALRGRLADLERAHSARTVRLEVFRGDPGSSLEAARAAGSWGRIELVSGESGMLGSRGVTPFVASFEVEVAHDSGVADPDVGRALCGATLHLSAARAERGRAILIEGFLDVATLVEVVRFAPGTPDLGSVQEPTIAAFQAVFAGRVASGEGLVVDVRGSGIEGLDGAWWIVAETDPDLEAAGGWRVRDMALLEARVDPLPLPRAGLAADDDVPIQRPPAPAPQLAALDVLQAAAQAVARSGGETAWPALEAAGGLIVGPTDDAAWAEVDAVADAAERAHLAGAELEFAVGGLAIRMPIAAGRPARLMMGEERTWLVDYDVSLAPETWMPIPIVERAFDGFLFQGRLEGSTFQADGWTAQTGEVIEVTPEESTLGRMQLPERQILSGRWSLPVGGGVRVLSSDPMAPAVELRSR